MSRHTLAAITVFLVQKLCSGLMCTNTDPQCKPWADRWECYHNPNYMVSKCAKACNAATVCGGNTTDTSHACWHRAGTGYCERTDIDPLGECNTTCQIRYETTCVTPESVSHAHYTVRDSYRFMDRVVYNCDEGYEKTNVRHLGKMICSDTGKWLPRIVEGWKKPTCVLISCGHPPRVNHTWMSYNGTAYKDAVTYGCEEGYYGTGGDSVRVCLENKQWNGTNLICRENITSATSPTTVSPTMMADSPDLVPSAAHVTPTTRTAIQASWESDEPVMSTSAVEEIPLYETSTLFDNKPCYSTSLAVKQNFEDSVFPGSSIEIRPTPSAHSLMTYSLSLDKRYSTTADFTGATDVSGIESGQMVTVKEPLTQTTVIESVTEFFVHSTAYSVDMSSGTSPLEEQTSVPWSSLYTTEETVASEWLLSVVVSEAPSNNEVSKVLPLYTEEIPIIKPTQATTAKPKCKCKTNCNSSPNKFASAYTHMSFDEIMNMTRTIKTFKPKTVEAKGAEYFGASAIAILGCIFGFIFLLDTLTLARHFKILRHNLNCVRKEDMMTENELWET